MSTFGNTLRVLRRNAGMGLRELARASKLSPTFLSRIENGRDGYYPSMSAIKRLGIVLGVNDLDWFAARGGKISDDLTQIIIGNPSAMARLLRAAKKLRPNEMERLLRFAEGK